MEYFHGIPSYFAEYKISLNWSGKSVMESLLRWKNTKEVYKILLLKQRFGEDLRPSEAGSIFEKTLALFETSV